MFFHRTKQKKRAFFERSLEATKQLSLPYKRLTPIRVVSKLLRYALPGLVIPVLSLFISWLDASLSHMRTASARRNDKSHHKSTIPHYFEYYDEDAIVEQQRKVIMDELGDLYRENLRVAETDALTGLPHHRTVMRRIEETVAHCVRGHGSCAVLFIDLDNFKRVNDTWGHLIGDSVLCACALRLRESMRMQDFVGRYGGEEFAVVLTDVDEVEAYQAAERILQIIAMQPYAVALDEDTTEIVSLTVTASIGVAVYSFHDRTGQRLIEAADRAMYSAKQNGRNQVWSARRDQSSPASRRDMPVIS